ncbi:YitT family protein [Enterococcus sp. BWR-S5]|uniref:YitT family protein n=1 Tax=Enterococcus sp. BWR-S5 TaxID=2787714 RepID=UPI0019235CB2|nr:YitT family protein [Enterococcus sp. BWR-S5]MBL1225663.1 YitT family protein [Enterococcus sp. BWR-S5]
MGKNLVLHKRSEFIKKIFVIALTGITGAMGLNMFLIPAQVFSAGMNGIAQILATLLYSHLSITIDTGLFIFLLNLPVFALGFWKLGKEATIFSFVNVAVASAMTMILPVYTVTDNPLMNAIVGGVLIGIGAGLSLKMGFTTGGMDIISLVLSRTTGNTVGKYIFALNSIIVAIAGFLFNWESALYTIISIYCMTQVIDALHTSHQKVTAMIITTNSDAVVQGIASQMARGMTLLPSIGGYSKAEGRMIMMVITRYELYDLEQIVHSIDENAFMNIVPTQTVLGRFANEDEQRFFKSTGSFPEMKKHRIR